MCQDCQIATSYPAHRMYCLKCIHCGARLVQSIATLRIPVSESTARQAAVIRDWTQYGHNRQRLMRLVDGPMALAPPEVKKRDRH